LHWNQIFLAWIALILQELLMKDIKSLLQVNTSEGLKSRFSFKFNLKSSRWSNSKFDFNQLELGIE
jgi:hypothetical protein